MKHFRPIFFFIQKKPRIVTECLGDDTCSASDICGAHDCEGSDLPYPCGDCSSDTSGCPSDTCGVQDNCGAGDTACYPGDHGDPCGDCSPSLDSCSYENGQGEWKEYQF